MIWFCIGYRGLDTQYELHPKTTVSEGNLDYAREIAKNLVNYPKFYEESSNQAKENCNRFFGEKVYIDNMSEILKGIISDD